MVIDVDLAADPPAPKLLEPTDVNGFKVVARGGDEHRLGDVLVSSHAGRVEGGEAYIAADWVRFQAAGQVDETWDDAFEGMLAYARTRGWIDDGAAGGTTIMAHIEWA